jgi:cytosine/adenosine deaminase-related metal-dependent hydrolase
VRCVHADWLIVPGAAPLRDGALVLDADDVVVAVGPAQDVLADPRFAGVQSTRIRGVAFPGLVNAHAHVELSALHERIPGGRGFVPWVKELIATRPTVEAAAADAAISAAAAALRASGTVALGDVTNGLGAVNALARAGLGGVIFHEVFSLDDGRARKRIAAMADERAVLGAWPASFGYSVAPHTLYTLGPAVVRELAGAARAARSVTSLHLAEHAGERAALERGAGPVVDWLTAQLGIDAAALPWPKLGPIAAARELGALGPHVLLVHLTDATAEELAVVAAADAPVALCPRSNLHIEGRLPPLPAMRAAGVALALGTDSLASNASLDVLAEAKALSDAFPAVPAGELVTMATLGGARALGLSSQLGTFAPGMRPGVVAVDGDVGADPAAWLLANLDRPRARLAEAFGTGGDA